MCALYFYASKLTAALLGGGGNEPQHNQHRVCQCHLRRHQQNQLQSSNRNHHQEASSSRNTTNSSGQMHYQYPQRALSPVTLALEQTTLHNVERRPPQQHYRHHKTKHKVLIDIKDNTFKFFSIIINLKLYQFSEFELLRQYASYTISFKLRINRSWQHYKVTKPYRSEKREIVINSLCSHVFLCISSKLTYSFYVTA